MKTLTSLLRRSVVFAALPAALAFSSCSNDDKADPIPDQGRVLAVHAAPNANVKVSVLADEQAIKDLNYGENSGYQVLNAGSKVFKVNVAGTTTTVATATQTVAKDKNYSLFAYSPSNQANSVAPLWVEDDLTAPAAGKAKIRVVHVGQGAASPLTLYRTESTGTATLLIPNISFGNASAFTEIDANTANLYLSNSSNVPVIIIGSKVLAAGKIYTLVVRGSSTGLTTDLQVKADFIENN
ncbi:protein of unknown function [Hymenobacter gelipurpurascens]|uniref:DUF4397 domain-containing protein n=1 Tax=Hymenobacter gelipurpurascens TaxID=89968 RepID=A0A212UBW8_9BACT|nr:DUF4397 domain-containing protein [Hymenobacter gelipurpurascens]SNC75683.1 protein of unknown function [Hymenobacter gelipurpurascens]